MYIGAEVSSSKAADDSLRRLPGPLAASLECARAAQYASSYRPGETAIRDLVEASWQCHDLVELASECDDAPLKAEGGPFVSHFMESLDPPLNACLALKSQGQAGLTQGHSHTRSRDLRCVAKFHHCSRAD
eukprot:1669177-Amphidinium_carterae.1